MRDDLGIARQLGQPGPELRERNGEGTRDVTGRELLGRPNVDDEDPALLEAIQQIRAADRLQLVAGPEVVAR